jgi:hypothetical protein
MSEDKSNTIPTRNDPCRSGAISYSLQYSHSIDMISDSVTYFQQILKRPLDV